LEILCRPYESLPAADLARVTDRLQQSLELCEAVQPKDLSGVHNERDLYETVTSRRAFTRMDLTDLDF